MLNSNKTLNFRQFRGKQVFEIVPFSFSAEAAACVLNDASFGIWDHKNFCEEKSPLAR